MAYLQINTMPGSRDYGRLVNIYSNKKVRDELMKPGQCEGMRKHFTYLEIDKSPEACMAEYRGPDKYFKVNLDALGLTNSEHKEAFLSGVKVTDSDLIKGGPDGNGGIVWQ